MISDALRDEMMLDEIENAPDSMLTVVHDDSPQPVLSSEVLNSLTAGKEPGATGPGTSDEMPDTSPNHIGAPDGEKVHAENSDDKVNFSLSELIDAETGVELLSYAMVLLALLTGNFVPALDFGSMKDIEKEMSLDAGEKKTLRKPLEKVFQTTTVGTKSPLLALIIVFVLIFAMKMFFAYQAKRERDGDDDGGEWDTTGRDGNVVGTSVRRTASGRKSRAKDGAKRGRPSKNPIVKPMPAGPLAHFPGADDDRNILLSPSANV